MKNQHATKEILDLIRRRAGPGTAIPRPQSRGGFVVKGWGRRRDEQALVYNFPNRRDPSRPCQKGITMSAWKTAPGQLFRAGEFTGKWFRESVAGCHDEGTCNFTTIGGIPGLPGIARYTGPGVYRKS